MNSTEFCVDHYQNNPQLWVDANSPDFLFYWLRMHNCYLNTGVPYGRQYCVDYRDHDSSWGKK
jgi:hypothetical protein